MSGAVLLAGIAALRCGAGKLQIATVESRAIQLGYMLPEALVISLRETKAGGVHRSLSKMFARRAAEAHAILIGPGMVEDDDADVFLADVLSNEPVANTIVVDAGALPNIRTHAKSLRPWLGRVILTPHAGEMANMLGVERATVEAQPLEAAQQLTAELGAVVIMKGSETFVSAPSGIWHYQGGGVGLATSGSGDVLAGAVAGLSARGASAIEASLWGVYLHGEAGAQLTKTIGPLGFLAREIADVFPRLMDAAKSAE